MKKTLGAVVALALAAAVVHGATEVKSVNTVGFTKKSLPAGGAVLTTCNFNPIGGGTNTLLSVFGTTQLAQDDSVGLCDLVLIWDTGTSLYQAWAQWTDGKFYKAGSLAEWNAAIEGNPAIPAGSALWVVAASGAPTKDLAFMGEVVASSTQQVAVVAGPQLIAYPFSTSYGMQNMGFAASGATGNDSVGLADQILVWQGSQYQTYALWSGDGKWYKANDLAEWNAAIEANNTIGMAEGFWYIAQGGFTWTEANPYVGNL